MAIDRVEASRALAKVIAYRNCGKVGEARQWTARLVALLEAEDVLKDDARAWVSRQQLAVVR